MFCVRLITVLKEKLALAKNKNGKGKALQKSEPALKKKKTN